jgi:hypothetical protein
VVIGQYVLGASRSRFFPQAIYTKEENQKHIRRKNLLAAFIDGSTSKRGRTLAPGDASYASHTRPSDQRNPDRIDLLVRPKKQQPENRF